MAKFLPLAPYITFSMGIFLNFFWIFHRETLSIESQIFCLLTTVFLVLISSLLGAISQTGKKKRMFLLGGQWVLFVYYLYILSMLLFFGGLFQIYRNYQGDFQLIPFHTIDLFLSHYRNTGSLMSLKNLLGNLVIMMPLGYFIPTLFPKMRKFWVFIPFAGVAAIFVEVIQWKTGRGIGDIDDSILNFLGAVFAYFLTRCHQMLQNALKT